MDGRSRQDEFCARCGDDVATGSARYADRVRAADGRLLCAECVRTERGIVIPVYPETEVPITQPNPNFPQTH
jgi:hypothetical protein